MRTRPLLLLAAFALLAAPPVHAAQTPAPTDAAKIPAATDVAKAPAADAVAKLADKPAAPDMTVKTDDSAKSAVATKSKDAAGKDTLSVDFPDEDVRGILRNVADLFELNIIMPETLQGKTTIKLRDVTWRQIYQNVLDPLNYTFVEDGNIIKIVTKESLNDEPTTTEIFLINYAKASDILPTITSLVDTSKGKIVVDVRSNSLVITERPTRLGRIRPIIEQLDRATDQVMIESKFVEVTNRNIKNIGIDWSTLNGYKIGIAGDAQGGPITSTLDRSRGQIASGGFNANNGTTNTTTNGTTGTGSTAANNTQTTGSNTTSSVTSTNGVPTATSTTGTNGALTGSTTTSTTNGTNNAVTGTVADTLNLLGSLTNTDSTNRVLSAVFSASQFQLVLNALQTQNDVKIVSNPTIVTLNNTPATINVGESDPIPKYNYNQQTGSFEVSGFDYKDIGIILKVTPQVNSRGFIKLQLDPEVSQKNGTATFGPAQIPIIGTRKASTQVSLKDGFTMGIGGLLQTQTTKGNTRVPLLGSVPLLGRLFRSDTNEADTTNLIIFITAKTISAEGAPVEQVFDSSRVRQLELHREDLPGYRDGSSPYLPSAPAPDAKSPDGKTPDAAKKPFFRFTKPEDKQ